MYAYGHIFVLCRVEKTKENGVTRRSILTKYITCFLLLSLFCRIGSSRAYLGLKPSNGIVFSALETNEFPMPKTSRLLKESRVTIFNLDRHV